MAPLHNNQYWYSRDQDSLEEVNPEYIVYVVCEGQNTEDYYFAGLFSFLESQMVAHPIEAVHCKKTDEDASSSHPKKLLELAKAKMQEDDFEQGDMVAIVFDVDVFKDDPDNYFALLDECEQYGIRPVVSFPSFEVFLILHMEGALENYIRPNEGKIVLNEKVSKNKRYTKLLCSEATGCNPEHAGVGNLAKRCQTAIEAECSVNQDARNAIGVVTSNVGEFIQFLMGA